MNPWELFTPQVVFMVTTKEGDGWRCKPFSWLIPLNKGPLFAIMAKRKSQTLQNMLVHNRFSLATLPATPLHAKDVLMTTAPEPGTRSWPTVIPVGTTVPIAAGACDTAVCTFLGYSDLLETAEPEQEKRTHLMILGRIEEWRSRLGRSGVPAPLLHQTGKMFARVEEFEVAGF